MFEVTRDEEVFKRFWADERDNTPRWVNDGTDTWGTSWDDFAGFCRNCDRVYLIDDAALLYIEGRPHNHANIHFSLIRGKQVDVSDLCAIRDELLRKFDLVFGYVGTHNRGLKRIVEQVGLEYKGLRFWHKRSHGRLLEWRCYSVTQNSLVQNGKK